LDHHCDDDCNIIILIASRASAVVRNKRANRRIDWTGRDGNHSLPV
jgi:hypothetical protein